MNMSNAMDKAFFILIFNHFRDCCALTRKPDATCNCIKFPGKFPFVWVLCICSNSHTHINLHSAAFQLAAQIVMKVSTYSTFCPILKVRSYTTKHGEVSRKNSLVLDSILISVSFTFQAQISGSLRPYTKNCFNSC